MFAMARQDAQVLEESYAGFQFQLLNFIGAAKQIGDGGPQAYLAGVPLGQKVASHFHPVDQFQVFFGSDGAYFERHAINRLHVQYADAYTPYGPFGAGDTELRFFTLRPRSTDQHHTMPGARDKLVGPRGRSVQASLQNTGVYAEPVSTKTIFAPSPHGMAAYQLQLAAGQSMVAPSPHGSGGQYIIVTDGSMQCRAGSFPYQSCLFLGADDPPLQLSAPASGGCEVLVLQYRRPAQP